MCPSVAEHHQPLLERVRPEHHVAIPSLTHRLAGLRRIEVTWKEYGVVGDLAEAIVERAVQLLGVAARQIGTATTVEEEGVAGHEAILDEEALAARRVTRRVDEFDLDPADLDDIARCMGDQRVRTQAGDFGNEFGFRSLHMHGHVHSIEQLSHAVDVQTHHRAADMIGVIVRGEGSGERHPVGFEEVDQRVGVVRRIDDDGLTRLPISDQIRKVDHLLGHRVVGGEVPTGEQLPEVEAVVHRGKGSGPGPVRSQPASRRSTSNLAPVTSSTRRIGFLGPLGTFSEEALRSQSDLVADAELVPMRTFVDILSETQTGSIDMGFVAIENAIEGTVNASLDTLAFDTNLLIQREVVLDITMNLMALPGSTLDDIQVVASHPVANAQCRDFLRQKLPDAEVIPANSTADAARTASETRGTAALGPILAGQLYGLDVLAPDVADIIGNQTRFLVVAASGIPSPTGHDKTTVVMTQHQDKPGSLVAILHEFSARNINLTKLTSRPARTTLGQYCFIADIQGHIHDDVVANCLLNVRAKHADVKFLGSYPAGGVEATQVRAENNEAWGEAEAWMNSIRAQIS